MDKEGERKNKEMKIIMKIQIEEKKKDDYEDGISKATDEGNEGLNED